MREIPMPASDAATAGEIISRIGQLTRMPATVLITLSP